jgi:hypothetical protein
LCKLQRNFHHPWARKHDLTHLLAPAKTPTSTPTSSSSFLTHLTKIACEERETSK